MEQHINFITLGVRNLDAMKRFYTDVFGWTPLKDSDGIVFFQLNGLILSLFPEDELAADAGIVLLFFLHGAISTHTKR